MIWSKFYTDSPQIKGATARNLLSQATWRPVLYTCFYRKLTGANCNGEITGKGRTYTAFPDVLSWKSTQKQMNDRKWPKWNYTLCRTKTKKPPKHRNLFTKICRENSTSVKIGKQYWPQGTGQLDEHLNTFILWQRVRNTSAARQRRKQKQFFAFPCLKSAVWYCWRLHVGQWAG